MSDKDDLWTADDIRKNAPNWSLYCDGKLLDYMKNMSKHIQERGHRTTFNLQNSLLELDRTKIALQNATNQLMALQHKQFVENRVYDDDETLANVENVPTKEPEEEKPKLTSTERIRKALEIGVQTMEKYHDKITLELSDSEDEDGEVKTDVVYKLKDRYRDRPLPYIIGSKEWQEKWHIGLAEDEDEESEEGEKDEEGSLSSSPALSVSSNVPASLSESENPTSGPTKKPGAQDLFQSSSDENISKLTRETIDNSKSFQRQSHEIPKTVQSTKIIDSKDIDTSNSIFRQQKQPQNSHVIPTLIDSDPPDLDEGPSKRSAHKPPNLFLDDDDDSDDPMFDQAVKSGKNTTQEPKAHSANKIKAINLFADDEGDDFDSFLPSTSKAATQPIQKKQEIKNLFDEDDDEDNDELFLNPPEPVKTTVTPRATILSNAPIKKDIFQHNIFDDEPPDDDFGSQPSTSKASSFPNTTKTPEKKPSDLFSTKVDLFGDDDDDDIFDKLITPTSSSKKGLFEEGDKSEILFETEIESESKSKIKQVEKLEENVPRNIAQPKSKTNLFDSVRLFDDSPPSDDEQLFSSISSKKELEKPKTVEVSQQNTGEFYNDFSETITSIPEPSDDIKPKPVESVQIPIVPEPTESDSISLPKQNLGLKSDTETIKEKPKQSRDLISDEGSTSEKRSEFLKKIDSFSNPSTNEHKSETAPIPKTRQPKKLNLGNIDINVSALLPGAKRAKSVEKSDTKEVSDDMSNDESPLSPGISTTAKMVSQDNVDSSGRLANLNRNRAKNLSRRPSTRAGRQKQLQKSMESEEQTDGYSRQIEEAKPNPGPVQVKEKPEEVAERKKQSDIISKSPLSKAIFEDELFEADIQSPPVQSSISIKSMEPEVPVDDPQQLEIETSNIKPESIEKENPFSFLEDQEEEIDDFLVEPKTPPKPSTTVIVKATPAYIDELPPELDPIDDQPSGRKNEKGNSLLSQNALSLFGDDEDDDFDNEMFATDRSDIQPKLPSVLKKPEDDWSPYPTSYVKETPPASNDKKQNVSSALALFDDDFDNDDDIFSAPIPSEPKAEAKDVAEPSGVVQAPSETQEMPSPSSDTKLPASSVLGLFDDEPDDGDLFASTISTESKTETTIQKQSSAESPSTSQLQETLTETQKIPSPSSDKKLPTSSALSLFDDDDMDNNDIFDKKMPKEPKIERKPKSPAVANVVKSSLFGDDDDDDLFGGPPPLPKPVKQPPKKAASKIFSDDSSDDDLFGGGKIAKKNPPKPSTSTVKSTVPKNSKEMKISEKLFSDSEDDDLFGTKTKPIGTVKKVAPTNTPKSPKEDPSKTFKALSPSVENDPLADLLK